MAGSSLGATPANTLPDHHLAIEAAILEAMPRDLVRVLTGALVGHLEGPLSYERACLLAAHDALGGSVPKVGESLDYLRRGLVHAIRPEGVETRPETILLQVAFWLLQHEAQGTELLGTVSAAAAGSAGGATH